MAAAFLLTLSRGGYLGLLAGGAVACLVLLRGLDRAAARRYLSRFVLVVAASLLVFAVVAVGWKPAGDLATRVVSRAAMIADLAESSNRIRLDLWTVGLRMAADKPFLGTGPDSYVLEFAEYRDQVLPDDRAEHLARFRPESPHSVYLAIATGAGLPALGAFLVVLAGTLWLGLRAALMEIQWGARLGLAGLMAAATIQLVTNAFVTGEPASFAIWFVVLGALAGLSSRLLQAKAAEA
jgi:O-antigen ligase